MTDAVICDRCEARIDETYTGPMFRIRNSTGIGPGTWDLCPSCHTDVRDDLWRLVGFDGLSSEERDQP